MPELIEKLRFRPEIAGRTLRLGALREVMVLFLNYGEQF